MKRTLPILIASAALLAASPALAEEAKSSDAKVTKKKADKKDAVSKGKEVKKKAAPKKWVLFGAYRLVVGQGTFVDPSNDLNLDNDGSNSFDRVFSAFTVAGNYTINSHFFASAQLGLTKYHTDGGNVFSNEPRQTRLGDTFASITWFDTISDGGGADSASAAANVNPADLTGTNISASFGLGLPTSRASRLTTQLADTSLSLSVSRTFFKKLNMGLSSTGGKIFNRYTSPIVDPDEVGEGNALFRPNGAEDLEGSVVAQGGVNTEFYWVNGVSASLTVMPRLFVATSYSLSTFWGYKIDGFEEDEFSSEYARKGRGISQITRGNLSATYVATGWLFLRGGISTIQPPKTSDNKSFRFPFWNFEGAGANRSSVWLGATVRY